MVKVLYFVPLVDLPGRNCEAVAQPDSASVVRDLPAWLRSCGGNANDIALVNSQCS